MMTTTMTRPPLEEALPTPCTASSSESDGPFVSRRVWEGGEGDFLPQAGRQCEETELSILCEWKRPPSDLGVRVCVFIF